MSTKIVSCHAVKWEPVLSLSEDKGEIHVSPEWLIGRALVGSELLFMVFVVKGMV